MRPLGSVGTGANVMIAVSIGSQSDSNEVRTHTYTRKGHIGNGNAE